MLPTRLAIFAAPALLLASACTQNAQPVTLRSLEANGRFSFLCMGTRDPEDVHPLYEPRDSGDCPDTSNTDGENRHSFAMVTQTTRGEVAEVDLTIGQVVDGESTVPGFNFFPVGANPTGIVSTPGSVATFVGVGEVGKEGIFALPSSCTLGRRPDQPLRDLTTWSACRLRSTPGELAIVIDGPSDPSMPDVLRQSCPGFPQVAVDQTARQCPADLSTETSHPGRRKLVVSLPALHELDVIDAQELLDRPPGEYQECTVEQHIKLQGSDPSMPPPKQVEPDDLLALSPFPPAGLGHPPPVPIEARPAGFAQVDDATTHEHTLYVADRDAPLVHVVDTSDACKLTEIIRSPDASGGGPLGPLYPVSFVDPARSVTTKKLAASPLTIAQGDPPSDPKRYLYAIDEGDGSVMIFDISSGSTDPTPILRPRSALFTFEPPDRIAFSAPAEDVTFALRDHVQPDPTTGAQKIGLLCDPDPSHPPTSPGARYRPVADLSAGASPALLRGVFGFVALASGHVATIDVQDFDAPCRRPISSNPDPTTEDFRGCIDDALPADKQYVLGAVPTVTNEVTCQVVESNRARSRTVLRNDTSVGVHAPSLRSFPTLVSDVGRSLPQNHTDGRDNPRMLAADFPGRVKPEVWVGTTLYSPGDPTYPLVTDPAKADQASLALSFREPRSYAAEESFSAVYEGITVPPRQSGRLLYPDPAVAGELSLSDGGGSFCDHGVEDRSIALVRADKFGLVGAEAEQFADGKYTSTGGQIHPGHADYVEITSDLLDENDDYWKPGPHMDATHLGATCGGVNPADPGAGFRFCQGQYGTTVARTKARDFRVVKAESGRLTLESRIVDPTTPNVANAESARLTCCFPQIVSYEVRASKEWVVTGTASGYRHNLETQAGGTACTVTTNPLRIGLNGRVIPISCSGSDCAPDNTGKPTIGPVNGEVACVVDATHTLSSLTDPDSSACVFKGFAGRFIIYNGNVSGNAEAVKGYEFDWTVTGGFQPLFIDLGAADTNTSPRSMVYSSERQGLVIADGSAQGLIVVDLSTFAVTLTQ